MKVVFQEREYEVPEFDTLSFRETGIIKRATGLRPGEWGEAFETGDPDMLLAILIVALKRAGVPYDEEALLDSNAFSTVDFKADKEDEAVPPADAADAAAKKPGKPVESVKA